MKITVLSDPIALDDVVEGLRGGGVVVLAMVRPHAQEISAQVNRLLAEQGEDCTNAVRSSVEEPREGWTEFLYCLESVELDLAGIDAAVRTALQRWRNRGLPDWFATNV